MDDEDGKIRRNLIAASTIILMLAWLQVPVDLIAERLLGVAGKPEFSLSARRVWLAITVLLLYLVLRFRFSSEHANAIKQVIVDRNQISNRVLTWWVRFELRLYSRWRIKPLVLGDPRAALIDSNGLPIAVNQEIVKVALLNISTALVALPGAGQPASKFLQYNLLFVVRAVESNVPISASLKFELNKTQRALRNCAVAVWIAVYSNSGTAVVVPWILAVSASIVALLKLWATW